MQLTPCFCTQSVFFALITCEYSPCNPTGICSARRSVGLIYLLFNEKFFFIFFMQYMFSKSHLRRLALQLLPALTWFFHEGAAEKRFIIEGSSVDLRNLSVMMSEETQWRSAGIFISLYAQSESLVRHLRKTAPMALQNCQRHLSSGTNRENSVQTGYRIVAVSHA